MSEQPIVFPQTILYKKDEIDFLGTELELIRVTDGSCATAYYARLKGSTSEICAIPIGRIERILQGNDPYYFKDIAQLHNKAKHDAERTLECIERYKQTGIYFDSK